MSTVGNYRGPNIITNNISSYLDAGTSNSYSIYFSQTTWKDISNSGNNATLVNNPIFVNSGESSYILLDGIDDYCLTSITGNPTYLTFECTFKFNNISSTSVVVGKYNGSGQDYWMGLLSGNIVFSTNGSVLNSNISVNTNNIYIVTCVLSSISKDIYVNGVLANSTSPISSSPNGNLVLGNFGLSGGFPSSINLYNFKFYTSNLTSTEILQNYNSTKSRFGL